ncbi:hypothetical protein SDC9_59917 [bioreactor metagenome]|uniref:Uncharacterized protein n=1 Tax=bioreactor metagenome TaxID=1076179 RepID=A0A644XBI1_9ZZZZ
MVANHLVEFRAQQFAKARRIEMRMDIHNRRVINTAAYPLAERAFRTYIHSSFLLTDGSAFESGRTEAFEYLPPEDDVHNHDRQYRNQRTCGYQRNVERKRGLEG